MKRQYGHDYIPRQGVMPRHAKSNLYASCCMIKCSTVWREVTHPPLHIRALREGRQCVLTAHRTADFGVS